MALINCEECGREVSDKAVSCPNCGAPISVKKHDEVNHRKGTLVIYGYTDWYLVKPKLKISLNGKYIGDVSYQGKTKEIPINEPTNVEIKCGFRSKTVRVPSNCYTEMHVEFDRVSGGLLVELRSN